MAQTTIDLIDTIVEDLTGQPLVINGARKSGKSELCKQIVDKLLSQGVIVKIFDASGSWFNSAPDKLKRIRISADSEMPNYSNTIYDTYQLSQSDRLAFLSAIVSQDMNLRAYIKFEQGETELNKMPWICYVIEESNLTLSTYSLSGNSDNSGVISDMVSISRNFRINFIAITTRLSEVSTKARERANLLLAKTSGLNDLKAVSGSTEKVIADKCKVLEPFSFIYWNGGEYHGVYKSQYRKFPTPLNAYVDPAPHRQRSTLRLPTFGECIGVASFTIMILLWLSLNH